MTQTQGYPHITQVLPYRDYPFMLEREVVDSEMLITAIGGDREDRFGRYIDAQVLFDGATAPVVVRFRGAVTTAKLAYLRDNSLYPVRAKLIKRKRYYDFA